MQVVMDSPEKENLPREENRTIGFRGKVQVKPGARLGGVRSDLGGVGAILWGVGEKENNHDLQQPTTSIAKDFGFKWPLRVRPIARPYTPRRGREELRGGGDYPANNVG